VLVHPIVDKQRNALLDIITELLAALNGVVRVADRATIEFDAARAAITKAEGVTAPVEEPR
jgi:hypothetical protein